MPNFILVMLGGALGAGARFGIGRLMLAHMGPTYPWGTLTVNLAGGLAMGLLAGILSRHSAAQESLFLFLGTGILGGFTTFSAFSLDAVSMIQRGALGSAALYAIISVTGSIALLFAGLAAARSLT